MPCGTPARHFLENQGNREHHPEGLQVHADDFSPVPGDIVLLVAFFRVPKALFLFDRKRI
jgi:hypothetical protein